MAAKDKDRRVRRAARWWPDYRRSTKSAEYVEAEDAQRLGSISGWFYGNRRGASANQCIARGWGQDRANWLSVPVLAKHSGKQVVRIRYASGKAATLRVRIRQGSAVLFESEPQEMKPTSGPGDWKWHSIQVPTLKRGVYRVELFDPTNGPAIDIIGLAAG